MCLHAKPRAVTLTPGELACAWWVRDDDNREARSSTPAGKTLIEGSVIVPRCQEMGQSGGDLRCEERKRRVSLFRPTERLTASSLGHSFQNVLGPQFRWQVVISYQLHSHEQQTDMTHPDSHVKVGCSVRNHDCFLDIYMYKSLFLHSHHRLLMFQVQDSLNRIWCNSPRLPVLALWVMARVPSCLRVSATQWDDEDTIQDTLGRALKGRNKWGHGRGHGYGNECLLCSGRQRREDLPVYFPFYGEWLRLGPEEGAPPRVSTPQHQEILERNTLKCTFEACEAKGLLLLLPFLNTWLHGFVYIRTIMTHSRRVFSEKSSPFRAINKGSHSWA